MSLQASFNGNSSRVWAFGIIHLKRIDVGTHSDGHSDVRADKLQETQLKTQETIENAISFSILSKKASASMYMKEDTSA
jgi:hypothetical protein